MKKLLLGLGSIASVVAPVAAVISCGDSDDKNTGTHSQTMPIENTDLTGLKQSLTDAIALQGSAVASATMISNYAWSVGGESGTALSAIKLTFSGATSFDPNGTSTSVAANETMTIVSGSTEDDAESEIRIIVSNADAGTDMLYTPSDAKKTKIKAMIMGLMGSHGGDHHTDGGNGGHISGDAMSLAPIAGGIASLTTQVASIPANLTDAQIQKAVDAISADAHAATVTQIQVMLVNAADANNVQMKYFTITITAGKATDFNAVKTAFASVTGTDAPTLGAPIVTPGGGTGSTGGSGTNTGTAGRTAAQIAQQDFGQEITSTLSKIAIKAIQAGSGTISFADLGLAAPSDTSATYAITKPTGSNPSMWHVAVTKDGQTDTSAYFTIKYAEPTQTELDAIIAALGSFKAQTSRIQKSSLTSWLNSHATFTNLDDLNIVGSPSMNLPTDIQPSDIHVSFAQKAGTAWNGQEVTLVMTIGSGAVTATADIVITATEPVDVSGAFKDATLFPTTIGTDAEITTKVNAVVQNRGTSHYIHIGSGGEAKEWTADTELTGDLVNSILGTSLKNTVEYKGVTYSVKYTMAPIDGPVWTGSGTSWSNTGSPVVISATTTTSITVHAIIWKFATHLLNTETDLTFTVTAPAAP